MYDLWLFKLELTNNWLEWTIPIFNLMSNIMWTASIPLFKFATCPRFLFSSFSNNDSAWCTEIWFYVIWLDWLKEGSERERRDRRRRMTHRWTGLIVSNRGENVFSLRRGKRRKRSEEKLLNASIPSHTQTQKGAHRCTSSNTQNRSSALYLPWALR